MGHRWETRRGWAPWAISSPAQVTPSRARMIRVVGAIASDGGEARSIKANVSKSDEVDTMINTLVKEWGRIDILVNNAGVAPDVRADLLEATEASFDRLISINLKGPYFLTQLVARKMIEQVKVRRIERTS